MAKAAEPRTSRKLQRVMETLRRHLPELQARFRVRSLGLFGSYVRGTPRRGSDLDVLVEFAEEPSLFEFIDLETHLSVLVGLKVDLVMKGTLKPRIGQRILSEVVGL